MQVSRDGRVAVVGESHYQSALREAARGRSADSFETAVPVDVRLVPEPLNPYDPNAVRLKSQTATVGYVPKELARSYHPALGRCVPDGQVAACPGRIMGGGSRFYGIHLHLAGPSSSSARGSCHLMRCCWTVTAQSGEEAHQDILPKVVEASRPVVRVYCTLGFCEIAKGKYRGEQAIEVLYNGARVGQLSQAMSDRHRPTIEATLAKGETPACEGIVSLSDRGAQVALRMPAG